MVAAGGDGTIAKVMLALPDRSLPLAIVALGSANNIARSLGIAGSPREIAASWKSARRRRYDLGTTRGPWGYRLFVEAVGFGALAKAVAKADAIQVVDDGRALPDDLLLVEILNIPLTGPRLNLAPSADPGDSLLDVVCVRSKQRADMLDWLTAPEMSVSPAMLAQGKKVTVAGGKAVLRIDDKPFEACGRHRDTTVEIEREGLTVLVPAKTAGAGPTPEVG